MTWIWAATSLVMPAVNALDFAAPGPLLGFAIATTRTVGCARRAATIAVHDGSPGSVYSGTIVPAAVPPSAPPSKVASGLPASTPAPAAPEPAAPIPAAPEPAAPIPAAP